MQNYQMSRARLLPFLEYAYIIILMLALITATARTQAQPLQSIAEVEGARHAKKGYALLQKGNTAEAEKEYREAVKHWSTGKFSGTLSKSSRTQTR